MTRAERLIYQRYRHTARPHYGQTADLRVFGTEGAENPQWWRIGWIPRLMNRSAAMVRRYGEPK